MCPLPTQWDRLWKMLSRRQRVDGGSTPPLPLILGAWHCSTSENKRERLRSHLEWAHEHGDLARVDEYLRSLAEDEWLHEADA